MKYHYADENVKIIITFPKKANKLIANANVLLETKYFGDVNIKNFQIWASPNFNDYLQEAICITPYTIRGSKGYSAKMLFFENEDKWIELQRLIYSALKIAQQEESKKAMHENVDPDDIPL